MTLYSKAMTLYFATFGTTMSVDPDFFWGPNSVAQVPYLNVDLGGVANSPGGFFARLVGLLFLGMALGSALFGVSADSFTKQALFFHFGSLYFFFEISKATYSVTWVWQLQVVVNIVLGLWGLSSLGSDSGNQKKSN